MINLYKEEKTVKIPIRVVDGQIKYFYGGNLPKIKEGTIGDLIVPEYCVSSSLALDVLMEENIVGILPAKSTIMAAVNRNQIPEEKLDQTIDITTSIEYQIERRFVEIILQESLRMRERGSKKANLLPSKCTIPSISKKRNFPQLKPSIH